mgnify:CR=1 FL=1
MTIKEHVAFDVVVAENVAVVAESFVAFAPGSALTKIKSGMGGDGRGDKSKIFDGVVVCLVAGDERLAGAGVDRTAQVRGAFEGDGSCLCPTNFEGEGSSNRVGARLDLASIARRDYV